MLFNEVKFVGVSRQPEVLTELTQFVAVVTIFQSRRLFLLGPPKVNVSINLCS